MVGPGEYQCLGVSEFAEQTPLGGEATGVGPVGIEPTTFGLKVRCSAY